MNVADIRTLSDKEVRQIEKLAKKTKISEMLSFFEGLPRHFKVPRPLLLGSNNQFEILVDGFTTKQRAISAIRDLDEPFNPNLTLQRTLLAKRREKRLNTMRAIYSELRQGFGKVCLAEGVSECRGKIVRAHSLQKAAFRPHARNGHVYEFDPFAVKSSGIHPTLIGVNEATTFTGFCEHHDGNLFAPIEQQPFVGEPKQFFLYHYRAVAQAFYSRAYKASIFQRAFPEVNQQVPMDSLNWMTERIFLDKVDAAELRQQKLKYESRMAAQDWDAVEGYAWTGKHPPDMFAADFFAPRKDFSGRMLQDSKSLMPLKWLSLTVTSSGGNALVLLCAERGSEVLRYVAGSLQRLPVQDRSNVILHYVFCQLENFILLPNWWDNVLDSDKKALVNAFNSKYFPRTLPRVCDWNLDERAS